MMTTASPVSGLKFLDRKLRVELIVRRGLAVPPAPDQDRQSSVAFGIEKIAQLLDRHSASIIL